MVVSVTTTNDEKNHLFVGVGTQKFLSQGEETRSLGVDCVKVLSLLESPLSQPPHGMKQNKKPNLLSGIDDDHIGQGVNVIC